MKRLFLPAGFCFALAACGGGGGGGASGPAAVAPPVTQSPSKIQSVSVQRSVAGQTLQGIQAATQAFAFSPAGSTPLSVTRAIRDAARRVSANYRTGSSIQPRGVRKPQVAYSACSNGVESATVIVSSTEEQLYMKAFYDAGCTLLHQDIYFDVIATSSSAGSITGNLTQYTTAGAVFQYNTIAMSFSGLTATSGTFTMQLTNAVSATSPQLEALGISCNIASAVSVTCGAGDVAHLASIGSDIGATLALSLSAAATVSTATVTLNENLSAYTGALNGLALAPATFPNWTISGGSLADSAALTGQITLNSLGSITSAAVTVSDATDDATVAVTAGGTPVQITGSVKQTSTGQTVATFVVDQNGNGTVTYGNGTVAQISAWNVLG